MNAVLLGCCLLLDYVRRKQIEENKKPRVVPPSETAPGDDSRCDTWDGS